MALITDKIFLVKLAYGVVVAAEEAECVVRWCARLAPHPPPPPPPPPHPTVLSGNIVTAIATIRKDQHKQSDCETVP